MTIVWGLLFGSIARALLRSVAAFSSSDIFKYAFDLLNRALMLQGSTSRIFVQSLEASKYSPILNLQAALFKLQVNLKEAARFFSSSLKVWSNSMYFKAYWRPAEISLS